MATRSLRFLRALPFAVGCCSSPTEPAYDLVIPTNWASAVTHPLFPLIPGPISQFRKQTSAGLETITVDLSVLTTGGGEREELVSKTP